LRFARPENDVFPVAIRTDGRIGCASRDGLTVYAFSVDLRYRTVTRATGGWMEEHEYESIRQMHGSMS
jgi:hypothetical protein